MGAAVNGSGGAVRGVFFDAADVLYRRETPMEMFTSELLRATGHDGALSLGDAEHLAALKSDAMRGNVSVDDYWDAWLRCHGVTTVDERHRLRRRIMTQVDRVVALPGAQSTLTALKARGLTIGVITDTMYPVERKLRWLAAIGVAGLIDVMACSTILGVRKPDPAIYRYALDQAGLRPEEAVFVGHDAGEISGAYRVGMATIGVNADADSRADISLNQLSELLTLRVLGGLDGLVGEIRLGHQ